MAQDFSAFWRTLRTDLINDKNLRYIARLSGHSRMSCTACAHRQSLRPLIRGIPALQCAIGARPVASISHPLRPPPAAIFLHAYHHLGLGAGNVRCSKRWPPELMCAPISAVSHVQEMSFRSLRRLRCKQRDASDDCESNASSTLKPSRSLLPSNGFTICSANARS